MTNYNTDLTALKVRLKRWDVKHFTAKELVKLKHEDWQGPRHPCPPLEIINNMETTVRVADLIRRVWGEYVEDGRVRVVSGWRPELYNDLIYRKTRLKRPNAGKTSCHIYFRALDLKPFNGMIEEFQMVASAVVEALDFRGLSTGLGLYDTFVHVDTLATAEFKEHKRRWDYRTKDEDDQD